MMKQQRNIAARIMAAILSLSLMISQAAFADTLRLDPSVREAFLEGAKKIKSVSGAPSCDSEDCAHVELDETNAFTALCSLGKWLLLHPEVLLPKPEDPKPDGSVPGSEEGTPLPEGSTDPSNPDPANPTDPTIPAEPTDPADPNEPLDPSDIDLQASALEDGTAPEALAAMAANAPLIQPMALPVSPADIVLGTPHTIYQNGAHTVGGSGALTISSGVLVSLTLNSSASITTLTLEPGAAVEIINNGAASITALDIGAGGTVRFSGKGILSVGSIKGSGVTVVGGNVKLPSGTTSQNGRVSYVFEATGTTSAQIDGVPYADYSGPNGDSAYLWLTPPSSGQIYTATISGSTLLISSTVTPSGTTTHNLDIIADLPSTTGATYQLGGTTLPPQTLQVYPSGVTLLMDSLLAPSVSLQADAAFTLQNTGTSKLSALTGAQTVTLTGSGSLTVGNIACGISMSAPLILRYDNPAPNPLSSWQSLPVTGSTSAVTHATLDGKRIGAAFWGQDTANVWLPAGTLQNGLSYVAEIVGDELKITTQPAANQTLVLTDSDLIISANGTYRIVSGGLVTGNIIVKSGVEAKLTLADVTTRGFLKLEQNADVNLQLEGVSRIAAGITVTGGSKFHMGGTGALSTAYVDSVSGTVQVSISDTTNLSLPTGKQIANRTLKPTVIYVTNDSNKALTNTSIRLKLGNETSFVTTTDSRGYVTVWRDAAVTNVTALVLSPAKAFAAIIDSADPNAAPQISNIRLGANPGEILYDLQNAVFSGIQYIIDPIDPSIQADYMLSASRVLRQFGECNVPGWKAGQTIWFRVFATDVPNIDFTAETASLFIFSDQKFFTATADARSVFSLGPQSMPFHKNDPFTFMAGVLPADARVIWPNQSDIQDAPKLPGTYLARITIPNGNASYFPGTLDVEATITESRPVFKLPTQRKEYDQKVFKFGQNVIPDDTDVLWFQNGTQLSKAPSDVGTYTVKVTFPADHLTYRPGTVEVTVIIDPIIVLISPLAYFKEMLEPDPDVFEFTHSRLYWGEQLTGKLVRTPGEAPGNYPYLTTQLVAPKHYLLKIDPDSLMFYINYDFQSFRPHGPYDPLAKIDPIHDLIKFSDGQKLDMITATVERLNISNTHYGVLVTDADTGKPRPFTPSFRLRPGRDEALLVMTTEPNLNADGGYETDADGNPIVSGRVLTLTYQHLRLLANQRITSIAFGFDNVMCYFNPAELDSERVTALLEEHNMSRYGSAFMVTVRPVRTEADIAATAPAARANVLTTPVMAEVRLEIRNGATRLDLTGALASPHVLVSADAVFQVPEASGSTASAQSGVSERVIGRPKQPEITADSDETDEDLAEQADARRVTAGLSGTADITAELMELAQELAQKRLLRYGYTLAQYTDQIVPLDSELVVPYTSFELQRALYTAILRTNPYLMTRLLQGGYYGFGEYI